MDRHAVLGEIYSAIRRANELREADAHIACAEDTVLFGAAGSLDSLGLVALLIDVEEAVSDRAGTPTPLTDEHALSQRRNPFRTVGSLADFVVERLNGHAACPTPP